MDIRHLRYFVMLCDELHFGRAASRLHIVQPALSQQIQRLELELGVELLWRTKREVRVTGPGAVLYDRAKAILEEVDLAVSDTKRAARGEFGRLSLGFVGPATYSVLPGIIEAYRARVPDIELALDEATTTEQLARIRAGTLDAGFVRLPVLEEGIVVEPVLVEPLVALVSARHRLAREPCIEICQLAEESFILVPRPAEPMLHDYYIGECEAAGFSPRVVHSTDRIITLVALVAAGIGVSLVPETVGRLRPGDTVAVPLTGVEPALALAVATSADNPGAAVAPFLQIVREVCGSVPPMALPEHRTG